jgi:hypothetical protein
MTRPSSGPPVARRPHAGPHSHRFNPDPPALPPFSASRRRSRLWELYVLVSGISALVLPAPSRVIGQIAANRELLWANTLPTLRRRSPGFAFSLTRCLRAVGADRFHPAAQAGAVSRCS